MLVDEKLWSIVLCSDVNIFLEQKSLIDFSPHFHPFFTTRPTSESYNDPLKVPTEGSRVEYLPVGSQEATQTIIAKKKFQALKS